jgi:hypothetical protein
VSVTVPYLGVLPPVPPTYPTNPAITADATVRAQGWVSAGAFWSNKMMPTETPPAATTAAKKTQVMRRR